MEKEIVGMNHIMAGTDQAPVVQSIVSLTRSLRGQFVECFQTLLPNTLIFFAKKNERSFCTAKASHIFPRSFCTAKASHIFPTKNIGIY